MAVQSDGWSKEDRNNYKKTIHTAPCHIEKLGPHKWNVNVDGEYVGTESLITNAKELARQSAGLYKKGPKKKSKKEEGTELLSRADNLAKNIVAATKEFNRLLTEASESKELVVVVAFDEEKFELDCEVFQKVK